MYTLKGFFSIPCCVHAEGLSEPCRVFEYHTRCELKSLRTLLYTVLCNLLCAEGFLSTLLCTYWRVFQYPSCVHAEEFFSTLRGFD